jgi:hypothetical protein
MALLGEAMNRLSREYMAQGKATTFQALRTFLDPINSKRLPSYEEVAAQLEVTVGSLKTQIHRLRKQYTATVREEISQQALALARIAADKLQVLTNPFQIRAGEQPVRTTLGF